MDSSNYLKDISEIKNMMNKSSRFISLSGLSGILAGIYALIGASIAYYLVSNTARGYLILDVNIYRRSFSDAIICGIQLARRFSNLYGRWS